MNVRLVLTLRPPITQGICPPGDVSDPFRLLDPAHPRVTVDRVLPQIQLKAGPEGRVKPPLLQCDQLIVIQPQPAQRGESLKRSHPDSSDLVVIQVQPGKG